MSKQGQFKQHEHFSLTLLFSSCFGLVVDLEDLAADEPLDGEEGVHGVDDGLALGDLTNKGGLAALHGGDDRVGGAQVNPHHLLVGDL